MKQSVKVILFSCLVGTILAGFFFLNVKNKAEAKTIPTIYAFQVGVFKQEANAINTQNNYSFSKVIKDGEYYRVFIGVTSKNKEMLQEIFDKNNNYYYIKEIKTTDEVYESISKYDELLSKSSEETRESVLKNMLESLPNEL